MVLNLNFKKTNGRFKTNEKICLSISGHHPETWLPSWSSNIKIEILC
jgi:ubiquitin-conjugating enzyme E2 J1